MPSAGASATLAVVASFIIECYLPRNPAAVADALARAQCTAQFTDGISYRRTTYIPGDETCLHLFEAPSSQVLGEAARLAALGSVRIVEAIETTAPTRDDGHRSLPPGHEAVVTRVLSGGGGGASG